MTETLPDFLPGGCDVDVAITSLENAGWNAGGVIVAGLFRDLAFDKPARGLEIKHENLGLQQRGLDLLAFVRLLTLQQRDKNAHGAEQPGGKVGNRNAGPHRSLAGFTGDR